MGDLEESPTSWLQISSASIIVAIWGVNKEMEDLFLSLFLSVKPAFQVEINKSFFNGLLYQEVPQIYRPWISHLEC